jgi:spoIIIJ-associated protein
MEDKKQQTKIVKIATNDLLNKLGIKANVAVSEEDEAFLVEINNGDLGILIGYHGETLLALQLILALILYKKVGEWTRIVLDVGGWRKAREESLRRLAERIAERVKFTGEEQALSPMSPFERRVVHLALSQRPDVTTESEGEGEERKVVVKPK